MKKHLTILLLSFNLFAIAQEVELSGIIYDKSNDDILPFANIFTIDNNNKYIGVVSNSEGKFKLVVPKMTTEITISFLGFTSLKFELSKMDSLENLKIYLEPESLMLEETVLLDISTDDYLKNIINESKKRVEKGWQYKGYLREVMKSDNVFKNFSDGLVDYYTLKSNGKSKVDVVESRVFSIPDSLEKIDIEEFSYFDIKNIVKDAYNFNVINRILGGNAYIYSHRRKVTDDGKDYEIITFKPKEDYEVPLKEGYVIIDANKKKIIEYKIQYAESHKKFQYEVNALIFKFKMFEQIDYAKFQIIGDDYLLVYAKNHIDLNVTYDKKINGRFEFLTDFTVLDFNKEVEIPKESFKGKTLFSAGNNYISDFWENNNVFLLTEELENFIKKFK